MNGTLGTLTSKRRKLSNIRKSVNRSHDNTELEEIKKLIEL